MSYKGKNKKGIYDPAEGYNLFAPLYDDGLRYLNSFEGDGLLKLLGNLEGKRVLDIGCGTGRIIGELRERGAQVVGLDISEAILKITKKKFPDVETVVGDVHELPFEDCSFDLVLGMFLIVHLGDLQTPFDEVYRVLKPGCAFILSNINQKKAPKLKLNNKEEIVIKSYYHIPKHVVAALENSFFTVMRDEFVYEKDVWVNQIIKAVK